MNLTEHIDKLTSKALFQELDKDKIGKVSKSKFIDFITKSSSNDRAYKSFIDSVNEHLYSKSEKILLKLKRLREKEYIKNDRDTLEDLNW
jgi:hypothetical protein